MAFVIYTATASAQSELNELKRQLTTVDDTAFVNLKDYGTEFIYDMKYATADNFLKNIVYDCAECYLRLKTVKSLVAANKAASEQGFRIKIYDCYRPLDVQKKMWKIFPNATYVANPASGSIHNRGGAVDITLVDSGGKELNMGTDFDFFGKKAGHSYTRLSRKIKQNRKVLRQIMETNNFSALESEWWHYNLNGSTKDPVSNFTWKCN
jgi:D-alanyl-D-alanine dipeptidase